MRLQLYSTLNRYILKKILPVYFINLTVLTLLLILDKIFEIADLVIAKGIPFYMVIELIMFILPSLLSLTIPMSIVITYLMVFGELAGNHEVIACYSGGIHPYKLFRQPFLFALLITCFLIFFNTRVMPRSNFEAKKMLFDIKLKKPAANIVEHTFVDDIEGYRLYIEKIDFKQGTLSDILIYDESDPSALRTIIARKGELISDTDKGLLTFLLSDGSIYETDKDDKSKLLKIDFNQQSITIAYGQNQKKNWATKGDRELTNKEIRESINKIEKLLIPVEKEKEKYREQLSKAGLSPEETKRIETFYEKLRLNISKQYSKINKLLIEYHKKYALSFSPLIFAFIAFPLGIITRRRQKGYSYVISIAVFLFYWVSLIGGEALGDRGYITPVTAMWFANIILIIFAVYLNYLILSGHFYFSFALLEKIKERFVVLFKKDR